jgi:hypothetical protein
MPDEKGETRRARNTRFGQSSPEYEIPEQALHVWDWFWDLSARRKSGPEALTYAEVGEWQRLTGTPIRPEEVDMIMQMDDGFLAAVRDEQRAQHERSKEQATKGRK